jgi:hypothetical protein
MALAMIEREMPVNRVAEMLKVNPQRIPSHLQTVDPVQNQGKYTVRFGLK